MNTHLVEILPRELRFIFEVKKQSSCAVHLTNLTDEYIAFKVKTTSPKKYCVRPNVGIIKPKLMGDFTVTMQAQKSSPSETLCKDKFLIQCTIVPFGTTEEDITPGMFSKDREKYIEEAKIRVVLITAPNSPMKLSDHGVLKQELQKKVHSPVSLPVNVDLKLEPSYEKSILEDKLQMGVENFLPVDTLVKNVEGIKNVKNMEETSILLMENIKSIKNEEFYPDKDEEPRRVKGVDETNLKLTSDIEELKSKISDLDKKLIEAEFTILKLKEEKTSIIHEKETSRQELGMLRRKNGPRKVQVGFPPLFVCMVAMISLMIGLYFRS